MSVYLAVTAIAAGATMAPVVCALDASQASSPLPRAAHDALGHVLPAGQTGVEWRVLHGEEEGPASPTQPGACAAGHALVQSSQLLGKARAPAVEEGGGREGERLTEPLAGPLEWGAGKTGNSATVSLVELIEQSTSQQARATWLEAFSMLQNRVDGKLRLRPIGPNACSPGKRCLWRSTFGDKVYHIYSETRGTVTKVVFENGTDVPSGTLGKDESDHPQIFFDSGAVGMNSPAVALPSVYLHVPGAFLKLCENEVVLRAKLFDVPKDITSMSEYVSEVNNTVLIVEEAANGTFSNRLERDGTKIETTVRPAGSGLSLHVDTSLLDVTDSNCGATRSCDDESFRIPSAKIVDVSQDDLLRVFTHQVVPESVCEQASQSSQGPQSLLQDGEAQEHLFWLDFTQRALVRQSSKAGTRATLDKALSGKWWWKESKDASKSLVSIGTITILGGTALACEQSNGVFCVVGTSWAAGASDKLLKATVL